MVETLLHSGSFNDYNGNIVRVTFFRKTDLNASPTSLTFHSNGGTKQLTIWSRDGDAELSDSRVNWLNWQQVGAERITGSDYYKYTFNIICDVSAGSPRSTTLSVGIEGIGGVSITVPITQDVE